MVLCVVFSTCFLIPLEHSCPASARKKETNESKLEPNGPPTWCGRLGRRRSAEPRGLRRSLSRRIFCAAPIDKWLEAPSVVPSTASASGHRLPSSRLASRDSRCFRISSTVFPRGSNRISTVALARFYLVFNSLMLLPHVFFFYRQCSVSCP